MNGPFVTPWEKLSAAHAENRPPHPLDVERLAVTDPLHALRVAHEQHQNHPDDGERASTALQLALMHWQQTDTTRARQYATAGLEHFRQQQDSVGIIRALLLLASIDHFDGNTSDAIGHLKTALHHSQNAANHDLERQCLTQLIILHQACEDHPRVREYQTRLLPFVQQSLNPERATLIRDLAFTYHQLDRFPDIVRDPSSTLGLNPAEDAVMLSLILKEVGDALSTLGEHDLALAAFQQALSLAETAGDTQQQISVYYGLIWVCRCLGRTALTQQHFDRALDLARASGDVIAEASVLLNIGSWAMEIADVPRAVDALTRTAALAREAQRPDLERSAWWHLMQIEDGNAASALSHLEEYLRVERHLHVHTGTRHNHGLLVKRDLGRTRLSTTLLRSLNGELLRVNDELRNVNHELERANAALRDAQNQNEELLKLLRVQAREDALTGLYNRRHFMEQFAVEHARLQRSAQPLTVVLADIDHFKHINDTFTHAVGDVVLQQVATLLRQGCRAGDTVARYGGEEFAILLPGTDGVGARAVAERIRTLVEEYGWSARLPGLRVTLSFGLCDEPVSPEQMLQLADAHLYQAKHDGRNRVRG